jgi:hypothetical protein
MKWVAIGVAVLVGLVVVVAIVGAILPRQHLASRTLRVQRTPQDIWPVVTRLSDASTVPVEVVESAPPHRLVTRVTAAEKNFGGTWTITIAPAPEGPGRAESTVTITEDGWVANPIFRFMSRLVIGHHATMDALLTQVAQAFNEEPALTGE